ncbi:hypothetical protein LTR94_026191, partial [Friedmanniomyces endolithicus]
PGRPPRHAGRRPHGGRHPGRGGMGPAGLQQAPANRPVLLPELDSHGHPVGCPRREGGGGAAGGGVARRPSAGLDPPHRNPRPLPDGRRRRRSAADDRHPRDRLLPAPAAEERAAGGERL